MIYIPQTLAKCAENPIPGLHRPPGHSTFRSSEHMLHAHVPRGALAARDQRTLSMRLLLVSSASHVASVPNTYSSSVESHSTIICFDVVDPFIDPDCIRSTRANHTVSTSTYGEYGALSMTRAAGGLDAVPMACNARICSVAAPFHQCLTHGLPGLQAAREPNARGNLQRCKLFTWDLQSGLEATRVQSRLCMREAWRAIPAYGARLRMRKALIFGKAFRCPVNGLSSGATHHTRLAIE